MIAHIEIVVSTYPINTFYQSVLATTKMAWSQILYCKTLCSWHLFLELTPGPHLKSWVHGLKQCDCLSKVSCSARGSNNSNWPCR